jgi:hypothetical protein
MTPVTLRSSPSYLQFRLWTQKPQQPVDAVPQRPKDRDGAISALNVAIDALKLAEKTSRITPIKAVFASVDTLLATIRVRLLLFCNDCTRFTHN